MTANALYTDLSAYYDLMCADIDYRTQSQGVHRLNRIFGNGSSLHLDLACGTGPHVRHFLDLGYASTGLDINEPMLDKARLRCPEAQFIRQDMGDFSVEEPADLITCFLYSIHYNQGLERLESCFACVYEALAADGVFCFNVVDKNRIDNSASVRHAADHDDSHFVFRSGWHYPGNGHRQSLKLRIDKTTAELTQSWQDEHPMVALGFGELQQMLRPWFDVHLLEHEYDRIAPWDGVSGNALVVCVKRPVRLS
ncbi:class I SAM-dependent DNA methyltransferase [Hydrocarboniclastica marina]|uniref:Class I SAM-dependent methyltransferase n=1 Tax=Hydrocarboniclastica marina TaxID=2259620 RepID=A0A4V1D959_9ALTE|nr:class I SAM-dependent methyltransferase [Hydrocarboniclastica marina]QCF27550.1 class I SAM-dependent methyltransferase [Hydrocarboniclastica marina]